MTERKAQLSRRTELRGLGTAVALPFLEALTSAPGIAAGTKSSTTGRPPRRAAFLFVPNGVHVEHWTPQTTDYDFGLPPILQPLAEFQEDLLVLSGLTHDKGRANGDGPGDHARAASVFLTGTQPFKTEGANIRVGVSVDQVAARQIGRLTRFPSIELGCEGTRSSGNCDSGYSCSYTNNISWSSSTSPAAKELDPRRVFDRLFADDLRNGDAGKSRYRRLRERKSILDFVLDDTRTLRDELSSADRRKIDEYFTNIREIERRVERIEDLEAAPKVVSTPVTEPRGLPKTAKETLAYEDHLRLMSDLLVLAFQGDVTRVASFMFARAGSNRSYREIGVPEGHHSLSHHQDDPVKLEKIAQINTFHTRQLAYLLDRLKSIPEGEGTLLDNCMILYGSALGDGNRHNHDNLPVLLSGKGGGTIDTGRHVRLPQETPMCNLFVSMLDRLGADVEAFGDSTGRLSELTT